jgi:hypothetical protein
MIKNTTTKNQKDLIDLQLSSAVAKLLARENITISHQNVSTASFNVEERILVLPLWKFDKDIYDMLVGHEVSHALHSSFDDLKAAHEEGLHHGLLNVVEDIRIEKLIQEEFPGLVRHFTNAYDKLNAQDFFGIAGRNVAELCFPDRLNLKGKLGARIDIEFNEWEQSIFDRCLKARTWDDVVSIVRDIQDQEKSDPEPTQDDDEKSEDQNEETSPEDNDAAQEKSEENSPDQSEKVSGGESDGESDEQSSDGESESDSGADDGTESSSSESTDDDSSGDASDGVQSSEKSKDEELCGGNQPQNASPAPVEIPDELETEKAAENFLEKHNDEIDREMRSNKTANVIYPSDEEINGCITYWPEVLEQRRERFDSVMNDKITPSDCRYISQYSIEAVVEYMKENLGTLEEEFMKFMKETEKITSHMAREFQRKKSAFEYSRAQESKSGVLDVNKLHAYKLDDNIFRSNIKLAQGKNHGMFFLLDFSGSMINIFKETIQQIIQLTHFCRKANIPYEVFTFTDGWNKNPNRKIIPGKLRIESLQMVNVLSSEMNKKEHLESCKSMFLRAQKMSSGAYEELFFSKREELGGTPLHTSLWITHKLINDFQKKNKVEKLNLIALTDGESNGAEYYGAGMGSRGSIINSHYKGKKIKAKLNCPIEHFSKMPNIKTIAMRIVDGTNQRFFHRIERFGGFEIDRADFKKHLKKSGYFKRNDSFGFNTHFWMKSENDHVEEFQTEAIQGPASTKDINRLSREFVKFASKKKKNQLILNKFVEEIA